MLVALTALAILVGAALLAPPSGPDDVEAAVFFSLAAFVAHRLAYKLPRSGIGDIAFIPLLSGVAVAPSFAIVLGTGVALLIGEYFRGRETIRVIFNAAQLTIAVGLAVLVFNQTGGVPLTGGGFRTVGPFVAAFVMYFLSNALCFAGVVAVSSSERFASVLARAAGGASLIYDLIGIPIVYGFAYAYIRIGWVWSGALLLPLFALRQIYKTNRELQTVNEELLQLMVAAIEARDPYTSGHSQRVAAYSRIVSRAAGLSPRAEERVFTAALMHDVGKIHEEFAPILRKPGRLDDAEFAIMKSHSEKGAALAAKVTQFADLIPAIRGHHEAWDGRGYPDGLKAESIPSWARIIAVADTIDAMTTDRPYRRALTVDEVRTELLAQSGRQFEPALVAAVAADARWAELKRLLAASEVRRPTPIETVAVPRHSAAHTSLANT